MLENRIKGKPNCNDCGKKKTPENTSYGFRNGCYTYTSYCKECYAKSQKLRRLRAKELSNGKVKTPMTDEEFEKMVAKKQRIRNKAIEKNFEPKGANGFTSQFTSEKQRDMIAIKPLWTEEEKEMSRITRMANDKNASIYINYLEAKVKKEI